MNHGEVWPTFERVLFLDGKSALHREHRIYRLRMTIAAAEREEIEQGVQDRHGEDQVVLEVDTRAHETRRMGRTPPPARPPGARQQQSAIAGAFEPVEHWWLPIDYGLGMAPQFSEGGQLGEVRTRQSGSQGERSV